MPLLPESLSLPLETAWNQRCAALRDSLDQTLANLRELLRLDEYHREGHEPAQLAKTLGPYGAQRLDLNALSELLGGSSRSRAMAAPRLERIRRLLENIEHYRDEAASPTLATSLRCLLEDEVEIRDAAVEHFRRFARIFRDLRVAQLEIRSKYEPEIHDALYLEFDWSRLSAAELRRCPPFVVFADVTTNQVPAVRQLVSLLEGCPPLKILLLRQHLGQTADMSVSPSDAFTIETLPLALRNAVFVQTAAPLADFDSELNTALAAPRTSVISLLVPESGESQPRFEQRALNAVRSRTFPLCHFDPDRGPGFVSGFDLSANPDPAEKWIVDKLSTQDSHGNPSEIKEPYTFAHFAATSLAFQSQFTEVDLDGPALTLVPLAEYLELTPRQRIGKTPFVARAQPGAPHTRHIVSPTLVARTADCARRWKMLQELAGIDNPHVRIARDELRSALQRDHEAELAKLREEWEAETVKRENAAIAGVVRQLVANFTGVDPGAVSSNS